MRRSLDSSRYLKRKRSPYSERDRRKQRRASPTPSNCKEFSFLDYRRDLNKIILYSNESNTVANNLDDFWIFLKKYEATLKKVGKPLVEVKSDSKSSNNFSKLDCINFNTHIKYVDIARDDSEGRKLDKNLFEAFLNIVSVYIDFKNKEKFEKLKKLRQAQKDLPVAKYR